MPRRPLEAVGKYLYIFSSLYFWNLVCTYLRASAPNMILLRIRDGWNPTLATNSAEIWPTNEHLATGQLESPGGLPHGKQTISPSLFFLWPASLNRNKCGRTFLTRETWLASEELATGQMRPPGGPLHSKRAILPSLNLLWSAGS